MLRTGAHVGEQVEPLAERDVHTLESAGNRVVTGPFKPTRVRSRESRTACGSSDPDRSITSRVSSTCSQAIETPVASTARTVAAATSGPIPSPGSE